jgi:hypothetical protein
MRLLRAIVVAALAIWCVLFLFRFADTQHLLWEAREDRGIHLLPSRTFVFGDRSPAHTVSAVVGHFSFLATPRKGLDPFFIFLLGQSW